MTISSSAFEGVDAERERDSTFSFFQLFSVSSGCHSHRTHPVPIIPREKHQTQRQRLRSEFRSPAWADTEQAVPALKCKKTEYKCPSGRTSPTAWPAFRFSHVSFSLCRPQPLLLLISAFSLYILRRFASLPVNKKVKPVTHSKRLITMKRQRFGHSSLGWAVLQTPGKASSIDLFGCGVVTFGAYDCLGVFTSEELERLHASAKGNTAEHQHERRGFSYPWLLASRVLLREPIMKSVRWG
jgi:hypothetical protein